MVLQPLPCSFHLCFPLYFSSPKFHPITHVCTVLPIKIQIHKTPSGLESPSRSFLRKQSPPSLLPQSLVDASTPATTISCLEWGSYGSLSLPKAHEPLEGQDHILVFVCPLRLFTGAKVSLINITPIKAGILCFFITIVPWGKHSEYLINIS